MTSEKTGMTCPEAPTRVQAEDVEVSPDPISTNCTEHASFILAELHDVADAATLARWEEYPGVPKRKSLSKVTC